MGRASWLRTVNLTRFKMRPGSENGVADSWDGFEWASFFPCKTISPLSNAQKTREECLMPPQVSVVMSVYNRTRYLRDCIESILSQSFADFEFIIIDDGSTDDTWTLLTDYASQDQRIVLLRNEQNLGISKSRNRGLAASQAELIAVMDSDDVSLRDRFAIQVDYLRNHRECVAVGSEALHIDPAGWPIGVRGQLLDHDAIEHSFLHGRGGAIVHPSAMIRRAALEQIGGYNPDYVASLDFDLFIRLASVGKLANLPQVLLKFRQHLERISTEKKGIQHDIIAQVVKREWTERGLGQPPEDLLATVKVIPQAKAIADQGSRESWARTALAQGYYLTSCKHALALLLQQPTSLKTWKLTLRALAKLILHRQPRLNTHLLPTPAAQK